MNIFSFLFDLFTEKKCYACRQVWHFFCPKCLEQLFIYSPFCYVCKKPSKNFVTHEHCRQWFCVSQCIVFTRYRNPAIQRALKHGKYYGKYALYEALCTWLWTKMTKKIDILPPWIIIPVPMYRFRKWKRGYNQSEKIALSLSNALWFPVDTRLISRKRRTKQQSHLSQSERLHNLAGAFHIHPHNYLLNTPLYLIDDVISTGSTLSEIAQTLQKAWFTDIRAIVIASD